MYMKISQRNYTNYIEIAHSNNVRCADRKVTKMKR